MPATMRPVGTPIITPVSTATFALKQKKLKKSIQLQIKWAGLWPDLGCLIWATQPYELFSSNN